MKIEEKQKLVEELHDRFSRSEVVIITDYQGLDVTTINDLRRKLREVDVEFQVVKNTLLVRASEKTDVQLISDHFKGPSAVALSYEDPVAPAKVLTDFAKDHEKLEIKVGVMQGKTMDLNAIKALANLPSREELLAQLLSVLNGVPTQFVRVLHNIPQQMVNLLMAIKEQKDEQKDAA